MQNTDVDIRNHFDRAQSYFANGLKEKLGSSRSKLILDLLLSFSITPRSAPSMMPIQSSIERLLQQGRNQRGYILLKMHSLMPL